jgi:hypothetical protein
VFSCLHLRGAALVAALVAALLTSLLAPAAAWAQIPGESHVDMARERQAYTAEALREFNRFINGWSEAWGRHDERRLAGLYSAGPTVAFSPKTIINGHTALLAFLNDSLPEGSQLRTGIADFVAGEDVYSATGPYMYQATPDAEPVTGTHFTVLYRERGRWKIRSQAFLPGLPF